MATGSLQDIQIMVRQLTRSPSEAQLSTPDLNNFINTVIDYDFPAILKLFPLRTILTFYTQPGVDVYGTVSSPSTDPLYNFNNRYTNIHEPIFIAGVQAFFTQQRDVFYGNWPQTNFIAQTGLFGDGSAGPFSGTLPPPINPPGRSNSIPHILQNSVLITALDNNGTAMNLVDYPINNTTGALGIPGQVPVSPYDNGTVNYITGQFTATFPNATAVGSDTNNFNPIWSEAIYYVPGLPTTVLYYQNQFTLRPVPDKSYVIQVEANITPTELLQKSDAPQLRQWWQYIAFQAAKKIFERRMDFDSVNTLLPSLKEQEELVRTATNEQYAEQRSTTIYSNNGVTNWWDSWGRWPY